MNEHRQHVDRLGAVSLGDDGRSLVGALLHVAVRVRVRVAGAAVRVAGARARQQQRAEHVDQHARRRDDDERQRRLLQRFVYRASVTRKRSNRGEPQGGARLLAAAGGRGAPDRGKISSGIASKNTKRLSESSEQICLAWPVSAASMRARASRRRSSRWPARRGGRL